MPSICVSLGRSKSATFYRKGRREMIIILTGGVLVIVVSLTRCPLNPTWSPTWQATIISLDLICESIQTEGPLDDKSSMSPQINSWSPGYTIEELIKFLIQSFRNFYNKAILIWCWWFISRIQLIWLISFCLESQIRAAFLLIRTK